MSTCQVTHGFRSVSNFQGSCQRKLNCIHYIFPLCKCAFLMQQIILVIKFFFFISFLRQSDSLFFFFYRGARTTITDGGGLTALERRMDLGAITDDELFILFVNDSCNTYRNWKLVWYFLSLIFLLIYMFYNSSGLWSRGCFFSSLPFFTGHFTIHFCLVVSG